MPSSVPILFSTGFTDFTLCGFPHSEIRGSKAICASPRLIAACHVLRRLPVPRHPPCALSCLTFVFACLSQFCPQLFLRFVLFEYARILQDNFVPTSFKALLLSQLYFFFWFSLLLPSQIRFSYSVLKVQSFLYELPAVSSAFRSSTLPSDGLKWNRTTDLALIRRAL